MIRQDVLKVATKSNIFKIKRQQQQHSLLALILRSHLEITTMFRCIMLHRVVATVYFGDHFWLFTMALTIALFLINSPW